MIPYKGIQYSEGIAGGSALKYAVKLPKLLTVRVAVGSSDWILNVSRNAYRGVLELTDVLISANDSTPTIEEIKKLIEYPGRRIKVIIAVMISSGIRFGAWDYLRWKHVTLY